MMISTSDYIAFIERDVLRKAEEVCKKYGNGDVLQGFEAIKRKYEQRPSEHSYGDLKAVIDTIRKHIT